MIQPTKMSFPLLNFFVLYQENKDVFLTWKVLRHTWKFMKNVD
jgi:hypothetical protein